MNSNYTRLSRSVPDQLETSASLFSRCPAHLTADPALEQQVERYGSDSVDSEPALEVVLGDLPWLTHDLTIVCVGRPKVDEDVEHESDVDDIVKVDHVLGLCTHAAVEGLRLCSTQVLVQAESGHIGCGNGRVDDQKQNHPVPGLFGWQVMWQDESV